MSLFSRDSRSPTTEGDGSLGDVLQLAADRVADVVDTSGRAASDIRQASHDASTAEGKGEHDATEKVGSELIASLADRAEQLSREAEQLRALLERAGQALGVEAPNRSSPQARGAKPPPAKYDPKGTRRLDLEVPEDLDRRKSADGQGFEARRGHGEETPVVRLRSANGSTGLWLLATEMAVAGSSREEIEARLRDEFGVDDASQVLSEMFERMSASGEA